MLALNCFVLGETLQNIFTVKINAAENVSTLKKSIKEERKPTFDNIVTNTLTLWRVSIHYSDINALAELPAGEALIPVKKLSEIFPNHEVGENIDVIIKPPEPPSRKLDSDFVF